MGLSNDHAKAQDTKTAYSEGAKGTAPESHQDSEHISHMAMPERPTHDPSALPAGELSSEERQKVREQVLDILAEELDIRWLDFLVGKPIEERSLLHDLGVDSVQSTCIFLSLSDKFGVWVDFEDECEFETVGDCIRIVEDHLSGKKVRKY